MEWGGSDPSPPPPPPPQWEWEEGLSELDSKFHLTLPHPIEFRGVECSPGDLGNRSSSRSSASAQQRVEESSGGSSSAACSVSGEPPPVGLKLGKRTYFEEASVEGRALASAAGKRKARLQQVVTCQVEGCNLDLTGAKEYHRKHRVCDAHSKSPRVVVAGRERRFCQQCSRFHDPLEFDQKKRSCRKRLSDHNARRRKPPPEMISFNSSSSSFYDDPRQVNFLWNRSPYSHPGSNPSITWRSSSEFRISQSREFSIRSAKPGGADGGHRWLLSDELSSPFPTIRHDIDRLLPPRGTSMDILGEGEYVPVVPPDRCLLSPGLEATNVASQLNGAPDIRHALSLLSNDSRSLASPEPRSLLDQIVHGNHSTVDQIVHTNHSTVDFSGIPSNSCDWVAEMPLGQDSRKLPITYYTGASQNQEFQLLKPDRESTLFDPSHV